MNYKNDLKRNSRVNCGNSVAYKHLNVSTLHYNLLTENELFKSILNMNYFSLVETKI